MTCCGSFRIGGGCAGIGRRRSGRGGSRSRCGRQSRWREASRLNRVGAFDRDIIAIIGVTRIAVRRDLNRICSAGSTSGNCESVGAGVGNSSCRLTVSAVQFGNEDKVWEYAQASTVPLFKSLARPLRNVRVTVPEVVGVQVNVDDLPAVTVKPDDVVGGFDVDPDCAATVASRHATKESGEMRILNVATECFVYSTDATE